MLFDTHVHLLDERYDADRDGVIRSLPESGVHFVTECADTMDTSHKAVALAEAYDMIYAAVGVHPHGADEWDETCADTLKTLTKQGKVVAIGEIGLDYHYDFSPRDVQKAVFARQMALAGELGLPVVVHSREATRDTLAILRDFPNVTGVMHCFAGSLETLEMVLALGYYISLGGAVTFKNAKKPAASAFHVPLERLMLETDSPYMTPVPYRGERNTPAYVRLVAEKVAEIRGMELPELERITTENASRFFRIAL